MARRVPAPGEAAWRIVVLSGVPRAHELARAIRAAATFPKPFNGDELIRTVRIPFCGVRLDERLQSGWQRPADAPSVPLGHLTGQAEEIARAHSLRNHTLDHLRRDAVEDRCERRTTLRREIAFHGRGAAYVPGALRSRSGNER